MWSLVVLTSLLHDSYTTCKHKVLPIITITDAGNNYYGNDVRVKMEEMRNTSERGAYILMDRVRPPPQVRVMLVRDSTW